MARYKLYTYTTNSGQTGKIRLDSEKATAIGAVETGAASELALVYMDKSDKAYGIQARQWSYFIRTAVGDRDLIEYIHVPQMTPTASMPDTINYKSRSWTRGKFRDEDVN